jgi:hypothetical protein
MIFATAADVIPFLVSTAPAAPKGLAHTAIIQPGFMGRPRALWADGLKRANPTRSDELAPHLPRLS